jgi:hypothetical protein
MASGVLMLFALAWLTVSTPFVYADQQAKKEVAKQLSLACDEDNGNPLSNSNEEKTESGVNTLSEYLHEMHVSHRPFSVIDKYYKCHPSELYFAYHPELLSPPPEA